MKTMTRTAAAHDTALEAVIGAKARIDELIARLRAASDDHFGVDPEGADWGDASSLLSIATQLEEAAVHAEQLTRGA